MANIKLNELDTFTQITKFDYFIGVRDNNDDPKTFSDFKVSLADLTNALRLIKSVTDSATTIADDYFKDITIRYIITSGNVYIYGIDYTQNTTDGTITGTEFTFQETTYIFCR